MYKASVWQRVSIETGAPGLLHWEQLMSHSSQKEFSHLVDCDTAVYDLKLSPRSHKASRADRLAPSAPLMPVVLSPWEKPDPSYSLLVSFAALALSQATGILPDKGTLIYGDRPRYRT